MTRHLAKILLCIALLAAGGITFGRVYRMPHRPYMSHRAAPMASRPKPPAVRHPRPIPRSHHVVHHPKPSHPTWLYWTTLTGLPHLRSVPPLLPLVYAKPPRQVWVDGHYEDQTTIVNGVQVVQRVWIPGHWVTMP